MSELLAYLAGAMDADGTFGISKSTYHQRVRGDAHNPVYSAKIGLKQTSPLVPELLKETFCGSLYPQKPGTPNSKPMWCWMASAKRAVRACEKLLPFIRIKRKQIEAILELETTRESKFKTHSYWFIEENPDWRSHPMMTSEEARRLMGYSHPGSVSQAVRNGSIPADRKKRRLLIPRTFLEHFSTCKGHVGQPSLPPQLIAWRQHLWERTRLLNKTGVNGTPVYHKTGPFRPLE